MLKKNDEKINGFLFVIVFPLLLLAISYDGFESSYTRLKTSAKIPDLPFSYVFTYRMIPDGFSVHLKELMYLLTNGPFSLKFFTLLNIFILPYEN